MTDEKSLYLVIRYGPLSEGPADPISAHRELLDLYGCVWFGKVGRRLSHPVATELKRVIDAGGDAFLYLVRRSKQDYVAYKCRMVAISFGFPKHRREQIPKYYKQTGMIRFMKSFVLVNSLDDVRSLREERLFVTSSGRNILDVLPESSAGYFRVEKRNGGERQGSAFANRAPLSS